MSHKEKMVELRQKLERWKSHNEVHARPVDKMLYEFLSDLLKLGEDHEEKPIPVENYQPATQTEDDPPGGNNPGAPDIP